MPNYGVGLRSLLFEQKVDLPSLKSKIEEQLKFWIPNLNIRDVKTSMSEDKHTIFISVIYSVRTTGETDSIQINLN